MREPAFVPELFPFPIPEGVVDHLMDTLPPDRLNGYLHPAEGRALYAMAAFGPGSGAVVELGSFLGKSTAWLAMGATAADRGRVVAVDTFKGSEEHHQDDNLFKDFIAAGHLYRAFVDNLTDLGLIRQVRVVRSDSVGAASRWQGGPVRLLFIDADHSYEGVKADHEAWRPHLAEGALVAFHDVGDPDHPGVFAYYKEVLLSGLEECYAVNSIRVVRHREATA